MPDIRTSLNSPLRIDAVGIADSRAQIGMTICPGKRGDSQYGIAWGRDLAADINAIRAWHATALLTAMEPEEMGALGVTDIGTVVTSAGMQWLHVPIVDGAIADSRFDDAWSRVTPIVLQELRNSHDINVTRFMFLN